MLQYLCPSRVSPQAAVFLVFLEWDSFGFSSRDPTIPLHSNLFGISHTQKRASHSRNSGYSYYVLQRKVFIEGYAAPLVRSIVRRSDDDSTARTARRSRTYLVRPLAALAALAGRALAFMPVLFRRQAVSSLNSLLHPCRTAVVPEVLPAVLPPCPAFLLGRGAMGISIFLGADSMKIKNFGNDVQALARAHRSADSHLLQTPSGKLKENTLFERVVGRGKELLSKISGKSYELRKISYAEGKAEIQKRFNAQLRFFSGDSKAYTSKKDDFENKGNSFLDSVIGCDTIFSNPKKAITTQITRILFSSPDDNNTITTALQRLGTIYGHKNSSATFISTAMEYDALRGTVENAVISEEQIAYTTKLGSVAERAHKDGAYKDHAYVIAKLALDPRVFTESDSENSRYSIAVSTYLYAIYNGIFEFEKLQQILPLQKAEYAAKRELQAINGDLRNVNARDNSTKIEVRKPADMGNSDASNIVDHGLRAWNYFNRATAEGVPSKYAQIVANLTTTPFNDISIDPEKNTRLQLGARSTPLSTA